MENFKVMAVWGDSGADVLAVGNNGTIVHYVGRLSKGASEWRFYWWADLHADQTFFNKGDGLFRIERPYSDERYSRVNA